MNRGNLDTCHAPLLAPEEVLRLEPAKELAPQQMEPILLCILRAPQGKPESQTQTTIWD